MALSLFLNSHLLHSFSQLHFDTRFGSLQNPQPHSSSQSSLDLTQAFLASQLFWSNKFLSSKLIYYVISLFQTSLIRVFQLNICGFFYAEHNNYLSLVFMLCNLHNNFVQQSHYIIYTILLLFFFGMENIINAFGRGL